MDHPTDNLVDRLRRGGSRPDWERFVTLYRPLLEHWAESLSPSDGADDLIQDVLLRVIQKLSSFAGQGDRSFVAWLRTVMWNRWRDLCRRAALRAWTGNGATLEAVADEDLGDGISAHDRTILVRRALQIMQSDFEPTTWRACWEHVAADRPAAEVAAELGVSVGVVYSASYRVIRRLRHELAGGGTDSFSFQVAVSGASIRY
jgi:RNA polymerase sigma-70 factor (ECF subfamily)